MGFFRLAGIYLYKPELMKSSDQQKDLNRMIKRYVAGKANAEEIQFIEAYYKYLGREENIVDQLGADEFQRLDEDVFKAILANISQPRKRKSISFYKYSAAAVVFIALVSALLYLFKSPVLSPAVSIAKTEQLDVLPGVEQAILTLADGTKVMLDNAKNENIVEKTGLTISKTTAGQLVYKVTNGMPKTSNVAYNTIATSKGNQYQILLPDGTKVWLNAASTLKYPEFFTGNERKVVLTGEAYFEVAKNKKMPFRVQTHKQEVLVLGTHFNINSYIDDHAIKTTLVEGSIKVANADAVEILKPGQQALVQPNGLGNINLVKNIDVEGEIAWKNGLFNFNNAPLKTILNQLERWYDVKIDYQSVPDKRYNGMVSRNSKLSEVLNMLALTGNISFRIEKGKILKVISE